MVGLAVDTLNRRETTDMSSSAALVPAPKAFMNLGSMGKSLTILPAGLGPSSSHGQVLEHGTTRLECRVGVVAHTVNNTSILGGRGQRKLHDAHQAGEVKHQVDVGRASAPIPGRETRPWRGSRTRARRGSREPLLPPLPRHPARR